MSSTPWQHPLPLQSCYARSAAGEVVEVPDGEALLPLLTEVVEVPDEEESQDSLLVLWEKDPNPAPQPLAGTTGPRLPRRRPLAFWPPRSPRRPLAPRSTEISSPPRFGEPALLSLWDKAIREALALPAICFSAEAGAPHYDPKRAIVACLRWPVDGFYIGATTDPRFRWWGGRTGRGGAGGSMMRGHRHDYDEMHIVDLCPAFMGRDRETDLIHFGRKSFLYCENTARDARGQVQNRPNFMYVVVRRRARLEDY